MAVIVTVSDFRAQFPEFASTADAIIGRALVEAKLLHNVRKLATLYAAAHVLSFRLASISGGGSGGGTVTTGQVSRKKVGPLEIEYTTHSGTTAFNNSSKSPEDIAYFSSTIYGQHFLSLEKRAPRTAIGAMVVG